MKRTPLKRTRMSRKAKPNKYNTRPRDLEYLQFVRSLPCCKCGRFPVEAHHAGDRAYGRKAEDRSAIPLCAVPCHADISKLNEFPSKEARREWIDEKISETLSLFLADTGQL